MCVEQQNKCIHTLAMDVYLINTLQLNQITIQIQNAIILNALRIVHFLFRLQVFNKLK